MNSDFKEETDLVINNLNVLLQINKQGEGWLDDLVTSHEQGKWLNCTLVLWINNLWL